MYLWREDIHGKTIFIGDSGLRTPDVIACTILNLIHGIRGFWNWWLHLANNLKLQVLGVIFSS